MDTRALKWPRLTASITLCLGMTLPACSGNSQSAEESESSQVDAITAALENPLIKCQQDQASCIGAAKDVSAAQMCNGGFQTCLEAAAKQGQEAMMGIQSCRDKARECVTKAGANGAASCRMDYESCAQEVTAGPATAEAGAGGGAPTEPRLPVAGRLAPRLPIGGGFAFPMRGVPRLPTAGAADGGGRFRPPFAGAPAFPAAGRGALPPRGGMRPMPPFEVCFTDLRACVRAQGSKPEECAMTARSCLRGSERRGAGGAGGAGGAP
jgi:hypothetical protein